ncbi:HAD family hydrolase [Maribacter luteus]|uniref:HAD-IA family hydrolase n=1 Tax=Maribacter luteus TaxID=2594478 RepID=A0A6I2MQV8_9FLAO|nr:HAD family phosphatase [Maribacter luteus]MRX66028.1 HAD-IA family hydrolase [Maribacter luteus]|tara:strand:- start:2661 stop:3263 length:603 start_codon:yes stop_codon:yes gene_type:complete
MIKNIIFDFGDVFINLDKEIVFREMQKYENPELTPKLLEVSNAYEIGAITTDAFVKELNNAFPKASAEEIISVWNGMILDFPDHRLEFLEQLTKENTYRLFLLSNTNALHIAHVMESMGEQKYNRFKKCFEQFYLSHEIALRKPNTDIYEFVLKENDLNAIETLFVDDTSENTEAANKLGIKTWNLLVGKEDVTQLKSKF